MKWNKNGETILESDSDYRQAYLTWVNDFLSIGRYASYYGWSEEHASNVIDEGRKLHETHCKRVNQ